MFFPGMFQKSGDKAMTPQALSELIGISYDTYVGKRVSPQLAMQLTAVFGCVRVLAESVGMLPCSLYEQLDRGSKKAIKERLYKLLSVKPNGYMTPKSFGNYSSPVYVCAVTFLRTKLWCWGGCRVAPARSW